MARKTKTDMTIDVTKDVNKEVAAAPAAADPQVINQTIVQTINPALAKQRDDNEKIKRLNSEFMAKLRKEERIAYKPPKYYSEILSPIYVFTLNGYDVIVRFDGTTQYFPETVYKFLMKKLARILDGNTSQDVITEL